MRVPISSTGRALIAGTATSFVGGVLAFVVSSSTTAKTIGAVLLGIAGVLVVSFIFLLVGESEDRDRERH